MATTNKQIIKRITKLIRDIEYINFENVEEKAIYINGEKYTRADFNNFKSTLKYCENFYTQNVKHSYEYIQNNKEYHQILANLQYYKNKKHKVEKDFTKIEILNTRLERVKEERERIKQLKKKREEEKFKKSFDEAIIMQELEKELEIKLK